MDSLCRVRKNNVFTLVANCFYTHSSVIWVFIQHQNNPFVVAETFPYSCTYIIIHIFVQDLSQWKNITHITYYLIGWNLI